MSIADFSGRIRPDACPGALQVHEAADGPLARVRLPGGAATPAQLHALADCSEEFGSGVIELTSRANVQVRGLHSPAAFAEHLAAAGLLPSVAHERVRNIVASPMSGRGARGVVDVLAVVRALDLALCGRKRLAGLPGRFLFAVDDGTGDVSGLGADVTWVPGGRLLLAGWDTGLVCSPEAAVPLMLAAAEAFLDERPDGAPLAWRIQELENGPARITARLTADPAVRALMTVPATGSTGQDPTNDPVPGPTIDSASGPTIDSASGPTIHHPTNDPATRPPADRQVAPLERADAERRAGRLTQRDGRVALKVLVPLGRLTPAQLRALADSGPAVRLTPWRTAVSLDLSPEAADRAERALAEAGLVTDPASPWAGVTACTGRPGCGKALADVQADARRWVEGQAAAPGTPVHWAGCERRCGVPRGQVVELIATADGYRRQPQ
ncbi:precorrin-3B synthase [Nonomuraea sp. PA05]|uniref:precorrin-3B synthase n=1 Tax=Nonomuraea sp. PA05 TaxID=2604466 RepID=UPI0011D375E3|nr:precorrin-3B synthase [Nonomuraea sp. PA05]TYB55974.1 precorrin-3B synthase [Nonomuraea sp. PA05]